MAGPRSPSGICGAARPRAADRVAGTAFDRGWAALIAPISATDAGPGRVPGRRAACLGHAVYLLIAKFIARRSGAAFAEFLRTEMTGPLGLTATLGGPPGSPVVQVPSFGPAATAMTAARVARFDAVQGYPAPVWPYRSVRRPSPRSSARRTPPRSAATARGDPAPPWSATTAPKESSTRSWACPCGGGRG
ncbi:hypothetical protein [Streptomyces sp. IMTB 2501]|uniref:hypothetical protein n=1 Tax=Streptomyces sp. IMTB 2501 TaxID=1776340 RepID=UPI0021171EE0|nr:hypothetical protein [Streptomyces sp. IMTB 2501]